MPPPPEPLRVLLVDDDEISREILELLLVEGGYAIVAAASGEEALGYLAAGTEIDAVLADLQMPGLSGPELAQRLRESASSTLGRVLAMSGSEPKPGMTTGYDGFLLKPFCLEELSAALQGVERAGVPEEAAGGAQPGATKNDPNDVEILDPVKLQQLRTSLRPEQMDELFRFALTDAERQLAVMHGAVPAGDDALYRRCAHSMKGSFGMLGASEMWHLVARAEIEGIDDPVNAVTTFVLLTGALSKLRNTLRTRGIGT